MESRATHPTGGPALLSSPLGDLIDSWLPILSGTELRVLLAICRPFAHGAQDSHVQLNYRRATDELVRLTGLTPATIYCAIADLGDRSVVDDDGDWVTFPAASPAEVPDGR